MAPRRNEKRGMRLPREYMERKRLEGKAWKEAMPCLKRHLVDVVYRAMLEDYRTETLTRSEVRTCARR